MNYLRYILLCMLIVGVCSCKNTSSKENTDKQTKIEFVNTELAYAEKQLSNLLTEAKEENKNPRTVEENNEIYWIDTKNFDWTEGFFPGTCWYLYKATGDEKWKKAADHFQEQYVAHRTWPEFHDLGFVFNSSYGNGYKATHKAAYKEVLLDAATTLSNRFDTVVGSIKSWDVDRGWQAKRDWEFPVIIDNMMNLELLFEASKMTEDSTFANIAIEHANTTLKNHFRENYSSYHVVDYDSITGAVRHKQTAQGFSDESSWARGQAWGLYGYTMCYRYTKDEKYLEQANKIAAYILNSSNLPQDHIPYWDYDAPDKSKAPRDASAAAVTASALVELNQYTEGRYEQEAYDLLKSLSSPTYKADLNTNNNFLLKHSVGSIPHDNEIDVPLNYADYYYLEALLKMKSYYIALNTGE